MTFNPLGLKGVSIACLIAFAVGSCSTWKLRDMMADHAKVKVAEARTVAVQTARKTEGATAKVAADVGVKVESKTQAVRIVTRTITERIPYYVSPAADARCVVPAGFVRAHDAAAGGVSGPPPAAGQSDEAASGVDLSAVAATVVANYGACHEAAEQVTGWQEFYRGLQAKMAGSK